MRTPGLEHWGEARTREDRWFRFEFLQRTADHTRLFESLRGMEYWRHQITDLHVAAGMTPLCEIAKGGSVLEPPIGDSSDRGDPVPAVIARRMPR